MDINGFVGSLDESGLFQSYLNDKILLKDQLGKSWAPYPIVQLGTTIERAVSKLFNVKIQLF
jgi:cystathionine beta-synthase